jgi:hypothetical protein
MLVFYAYYDVFPCFNVFIIYLFFLQSKNMHNRAYVRSYLYYSNDFKLHKIQVAQNLQERNSCVTWGALALCFMAGVLNLWAICWLPVCCAACIHLRCIMKNTYDKLSI